MIIGGYDLHLYCANSENCPGYKSWKNEPSEFSGKNEREAMSAARRIGWRFKKDMDGKTECYCPACKGKPND